MKKIISILLSIIMIVSVIPMSVMTVNASILDIPAVPSSVEGVTGTGTFSDPYVVKTGDQLEDLIATKKDMNIKLDANLNLDKTLYIKAEVYINMNGKTITSTAKEGAIHINSGGIITMNGSGKLTYNGNYYAVFVEGTFETMGSITYETKNASYAVVNVHQYGTVRIYGGTFKGSQLDNNGVGQVYIYGGTFEEIIYNGPNGLIAIYDGTFLDAIGTQGKVYIYDGEFLKAVNAYYNGVVTVYGGHFAAGIATPQATGTHKKGENSFCISHKNKTLSEDGIYVYEEVTVYSPAFAEQSPQANGKTEIDGGTMNQYESYTVGFKAKDVPEIFAEVGFTVEEKLIVKDSAGNVEHSVSKKGTTAQGVYYNLQELDGGDYTAERIINIYRNGSVVGTKKDTVKVKINPLSSSDFGFKIMTPSVSDEDKADRYTELADKEIGTQNFTFGFTSQLSEELKNKGYSVKEKIYVNYNNQATIITLNSGANFNLMKYVDRLGDYQVWFNLSLYRGNEYVTSIGHIYNVTIIPNAVRTIKARVVAPKAGALPDFTVNAEGEGYKTTDVDWSYYDEKADTYYIMPNGMKFEAGKTYECAVQFEALPEYIFADNKANMSGYINGYKGVISPVYTNKKAYVTVQFTVPAKEKLEVIFTPDSKPQAGSKLTVDIEAMAELDDELMEAYLDDSVTYKWFYDGRLQYTTKNNSYELKNSMIGHYVAVKVLYGDEVIISEEFQIEEAKNTGLLGDATEDGIINIMDATVVQKYLAGLQELTATQLRLADVDSNGIVNIMDATAIQKYLAGLDTGYPIGK